MRRGLRLLLVTVMVCTLLTGCGNVETAALETMSKSETETEKAENKTDTSDWPTVPWEFVHYRKLRTFNWLMMR